MMNKWLLMPASERWAYWCSLGETERRVLVTCLSVLGRVFQEVGRG